MDRQPFVGNETIVLFEDGDEVMVSTQGEAVRFLLISGRPIGEPVAWYGPIVMNTEEELEIAFAEEQERHLYLAPKKVISLGMFPISVS